MKKNILSMFPYYGGKARMAPLICDMLDYKHTDTFVTPFGGASRVLLNKPHHSLECYGDLSEGLCTFVKLMSNPQTSTELIHRIYDTEYSEEEFKKAVQICYVVEKNPLYRARKEFEDYLKDLLVKYDIISKHSRMMQNLINEIKNKQTSMMGKLHEVIAENEREKLNDLSERAIELRNYLDVNGSLPPSREFDVTDISDMDLATAVYVRYMQSRDAMGQVWTSSKFKTNDTYHKQMARLYEVAERLEGVETFQMDAKYFYHGNDELLKELDTCSENEIEGKFEIVKRFWNHWITNPNVMMCCDPSYIDPTSEKKYLILLDKYKKGLITKEELDKRRPKNLGNSYEASFSYEDHEAFVKSICHAQCRMIVCNYNLVLYNNYLNPANGWKRLEFETTTGVGSKKNNKRTEVLWYNY